MNLGNLPVLVLALVVIGFVGSYALLHPDTQAGYLALGSLLPIAGGIGTYFFHTSSQSFLGQQITAQRGAFLTAMKLGNGSYPSSPSSPSASSPPLSPSGGSPGAAAGTIK